MKRLYKKRRYYFLYLIFSITILFGFSFSYPEIISAQVDEGQPCGYLTEDGEIIQTDTCNQQSGLNILCADIDLTRGAYGVVLCQRESSSTMGPNCSGSEVCQNLTTSQCSTLGGTYLPGTTQGGGSGECWEPVNDTDDGGTCCTAPTPTPSPTPTLPAGVTPTSGPSPTPASFCTSDRNSNLTGYCLEPGNTCLPPRSIEISSDCPTNSDPEYDQACCVRDPIYASGTCLREGGICCTGGAACTPVPDTAGSCGIGNVCCFSCPGFELTPPVSSTCDSGQQGIQTAIGCIPTENTGGLITFIFRWAIGIGGGISLLMGAYAGVVIITSAGDPQKIQAGKDLLFSVLSSLLMLISGAFILRIIGLDILRIPGL